MTDETRVGFWRAGHGGHLTVEENRAHDAACDGHGHCTWQREEPRHAAARQPTEDEQEALDHLRTQALRMRRVGASERRRERLVTKPRSYDLQADSGALRGVKRPTGSDRSGEGGS